ncbi:Syntaxin/t-SNARE family protein, putative isoform 2 [Theobroma cacao]|uniref:Syntaxin/t-SNARE family protein, putative isoform 2 n=1 Tax=Theobroma cacao TaxID=3641 RepID=A0A061GR63_THECC|nr:Syntaxin/t-SNARE family protein, putative isoform 2 [Theobroma cacao]
MMVANSFDLWQKDAFFSAAEEVQESADIMESAYRMWIKERREGLQTAESAELCRELQTALGTAKWQLEEFERAIRLSHGHHRDDITATRHRQFIAAIEIQICRVEDALKEAFIEEGKQPLRWVNLDEEERDDLAMFLSGTSPSLQPSAKNTLLENCHGGMDSNPNFNSTCNGNMCEVNIFKDSGKDAECVIDVEDEESSGRTDEVSCGQDRTTGTRRTWSSPNFGALKIVIADKYEDRSQIRSGIEATPKEKGSKPLFRKQRCGELPQAKGALSLFNQLFGCVGGLQRQLHSPVHLQFSCSLQLTLALMIAIFLIGAGAISSGLGIPYRVKAVILNLFPVVFKILERVKLPLPMSELGWTKSWVSFWISLPHKL